MFWAWDITVTAGRTEADPKTQILKLSKGTITGIDIHFPAGCHGQVKVRLLRSESQLVPLSGGEWVTGNDETVPTESYYELVETPAELKFLGCSPLATYDHVVTVRIAVQPAEVASPGRTIGGLVDTLRRLLGI
ncbi:MAG: hypothetical protein Q8N53_03480 [Longimicrobiales bacterium]|nr:hypothetical protein [Longimicrobiales bacterium]